MARKRAERRRKMKMRRKESRSKELGISVSAGRYSLYRHGVMAYVTVSTGLVASIGYEYGRLNMWTVDRNSLHILAV